MGWGQVWAQRCGLQVWVLQPSPFHSAWDDACAQRERQRDRDRERERERGRKKEREGGGREREGDRDRDSAVGPGTNCSAILGENREALAIKKNRQLG